ncbi:MAG: TRAP transporter large permease [Burkholderiales bacterium]|nr:TRAP transporter large permease [Burkholderiales bacterium]
MTTALIGFLAMLALGLLRVPIAFAMAITGSIGIGLIQGWGAAWSSLQSTVIDAGFQYTLSVVPLFVLMGNLFARAGISADLFRVANRFVGHWRGGLAMSTILACAGFGAICGSSIATTATFARVAYPSMRRFGYSDRLAAGSVAAGGTLGILIPPSTVMVIYGIMTETNIGKLFAAGVLPGILAAALLCLTVFIVTLRQPDAGPRGPRAPWRERLSSLGGVWPVVVLFLVVMGGIYLGIFTATEGAGIGAFGALVSAFAYRRLNWRSLLACLAESTRTTALLFLILIGALVFANFLNYTSMPDDLSQLVAQFKDRPWLVITGICVIYLLLGAVMEELSMVMLTIPVFFPLVVGLGFDPIWFGIIIVVVVEIGMISPPVGMNLFVIKSLLPNVSTGDLFRGVMPFVLADTLRLAILVAFPIISLWLPGTMTVK